MKRRDRDTRSYRSSHSGESCAAQAVRNLLALSLLSLLAWTPAHGQQAPGPQPNIEIAPRPKPGTPTPDSVLERRPDLRIDTTLVQIPVSVTENSTGRYVTGLDKEQFKLLESNVEQEILSFSSEDVPMSVGLVFDTSGSMGPKIRRSQEAVRQFLKTANPEDEFFLVQFNDLAELTVPFTPDTDEVQNRLTFAESKGRTALLDAVYLAMHEMKKARNPRRAILIISDGGDNSSRYTESEVKNAVRESDVQIYAIGIFEGLGARGRTPEEANGPGLLHDLAEQTGGRDFNVENLAELPDVAAKIGLELRHLYMLGFSPKNKDRDGKFRRIQVKLVKTAGLPPLTPKFKVGYYAPAQ
jgi:Ca-activated chloride channel homolog